MATWTKATKWLWLGKSGLQYTETITCELSPSEARRRVADYFTSKRCVFAETDSETLRFTRGNTWALLLGVSERQLPQRISVSLFANLEVLSVQISYDLERCWVIATAPSVLEKEVAGLYATLNNES